MPMNMNNTLAQIVTTAPARIVGNTQASSASEIQYTNNANTASTAKDAETTHIGVGRHGLPKTLESWPEFYQPPPKPATGAQRGEAWGTGIKTGGSVSYAVKPSVLNLPLEDQPPKYVPGAGGVAGHKTKKPRDGKQLYHPLKGWNQS